MHVGAIGCGILGVFFLIMAMIFTMMKEKGANLISGFNSKTKEERQMYDMKQMSLDQRNAFLLWALVFGVGLFLSYFVSDWCSLVAFVVWLILFFKDVHFDEEKAFGKYIKK